MTNTPKRRVKTVDPNRPAVANKPKASQKVKLGTTAENSMISVGDHYALISHREHSMRVESISEDLVYGSILGRSVVALKSQIGKKLNKGVQF